MIVDFILGVALFSVLCAVLFLMPFTPAVLEWRIPSDAEALKVEVWHASSATYFADRFRLRVRKWLQSGNANDGCFEHVDSLSALTTPLLTPRAAAFVANDIRTDNNLQCPRAAYFCGDLLVLGQAHMQESLAEGHIELGPYSSIRCWAHAKGHVQLGDACVAARRISSETSIALGRGCCFERLHAPVIRFGPPPGAFHKHRQQSRQSVLVLTTMDGLELAAAQRWGGGGWRIQGDCVIPADHQITGSLVVTGVLTLEANARVNGDVKARAGVRLGIGACVTGAVICEQSILVSRNAVIGGPVISEAALMLRYGATIGTQQQPTSATADRISTQSGVTAHGTVWARSAGLVR